MTPNFSQLSLYSHLVAFLTLHPLHSQELIQFKTMGGKLKKCELTLHWPERMTFTGTAGNRVMAEKRAAALACMKLKVRMNTENYYDTLT